MFCPECGTQLHSGDQGADPTRYPCYDCEVVWAYDGDNGSYRVAFKLSRS